MLTCNECKWWKLVENEEWKKLGRQMGECRKNAPNPLYIRLKPNLNQLERYPIFPWMSCDDWCGNFTFKSWKNQLKWIFYNK